jgi:hypothetical protein
MRQIKLTIQKRDTRAKTRARPWRTCPIRIVSLESGETVKRGCGDKGMIPTDTGWHCFYCGNYIYQTHAPLTALWFHFKIAREYWRAMSRGDTFFINGVPVSGGPDYLPGRLLADLAESHPPKWFRYYLIFDEEQFQSYLNNEKIV